MGAARTQITRFNPVQLQDVEASLFVPVTDTELVEVLKQQEPAQPAASIPASV